MTMLSAYVTGEDLSNNPDYPFIPHVPLERLRLDSANLPRQRRKKRHRRDTLGEPVCLAGDHEVHGEALFFEDCRRLAKQLAQQRRRLARKPDVPVSKNVLRQVHESIDALSPLLGELTTAYNTGGDLRDETDALMRAIKRLVRDVRKVLPDPRNIVDLDEATRSRV